MDQSVSMPKCGRPEPSVWRAPGFPRRQNDPAGASFWLDAGPSSDVRAPQQLDSSLLKDY